jgi:selenocysteine lyase/cysteine desulfurase
MDVSRRNLIAAAGLAPVAASQLGADAPSLPDKKEFPVVDAEVCLNNARWHPASAGAMRAVQRYLDYKASGGGAAADYGGSLQARAKDLFAKLINAKTAEIAFVPSTTVGENLVASSLDLPRAGGNVVTDALHFEGSLYQYGELAKQGLELRIARPDKNWRVTLDALDKLIDRKTKLVAVSLVSMINGFQHDLKAICDLAHSRGAKVYADAVQAVGAIPVDVRASGIDFLACSSYKWLMGDMGLGFLYVREDLLDGLPRTQYGFRQLARMDYHVFPHDPPGDAVMDWTAAPTAGGHFEVGTVSNTTAACLTHSLDYLMRIGVENIQAHRVPMLRRLQTELPRLGFQPMTPADSVSPIVTFSKEDMRPVAARLRQAKIDVAVYPHRLRISPSVYNDQSDIDKLLGALA